MASKTPFTDKQRTPPKGVADCAAKGLELREQHGRGGTDVGRRRAEQLKGQHAVSERDIKSMYSYFARHNVYKRGKNWGDDPGRKWIDGLHDKLDQQEDAA